MSTAANVKIILGPVGTETEEADLEPFVTQAEALWNNISGGSSCGNTAEAVDQIKCLLAAHYWTVTNERGGLREVAIGSSREEYASGSYSVVGLSLTRFGQQALVFDKSGKLRSIDSRGLPLVFEVY